MTCNCLIELAHVFLDKTFTYLIPKEFEDKIKVGMRVEVPFGKQVLEGFVMELSNEVSDLELKEIIRLVDDFPVLNEELISLGKFVKSMTLSSLMSSYQVMLPKALKAKKKVDMRVKKDKYIKLNENINFEDYKFNETQDKIMSILIKEKVVSKKELDKISSSSVKTLLNKKVLILEERSLPL